jgi:hypothetical protein
MSAWTREAIEAQGPTTEVPVLAEILAINKDTIYEAIRREEWDMTRVLRIGRRIKIPTLDIVTYLFAPAGSPAVPTQCQHDALTQVTGGKSQSQCGCTPAASGVIHQLRGA